MKNEDLVTTLAYLEDKCYHVAEYPEEKIREKGPTILKKGIAYRYEGGLIKALLPYRGEIELEKFDRATCKPGIYSVHIKKLLYRCSIIFPRTREERKEYDINNMKDVMAAVIGNEVPEDQFVDYTPANDIGVGTFVPPLHREDDPLNTIMKVAIRMKDAPFDIYGQRLEAFAANKKHSIESTNIKNNARRGIITNYAMSANKFLQYEDTWQTESAIIVRDKPGAMHPIFDDPDKMLIIYPHGHPFKINPDKLVDVSDYVDQAISMETSNNDEKKK